MAPSRDPVVMMATAVKDVDPAAVPAAGALCVESAEAQARAPTGRRTAFDPQLAVLSFQTIGGEQPIVVYDSPSARAPTVLVAPALGIEAGYYRRLCEQLAESGVNAAVVDQPGAGASPVRAARGVEWGYDDLAEHYRSALAALADAGYEGIHLLGHSIGGQAGLMIPKRQLSMLQGVVLVASGAPYWRLFPRRHGLYYRAGMKLIAAVTQLLGYYPGHQMGFGGRQARQLILEWTHAGSTGQYQLGRFDGDARLAEEGPPVLAICLQGDELAPEPAMRQTLDKLHRRVVTFETWTSAPHGGDHNRWPSEPSWVVERVKRFVGLLDERPASAASRA